MITALSADGILGASVGDSGAWLVAPDGVLDLTAHQRRKPFPGTGMAVPVPFAAPWGLQASRGAVTRTPPGARIDA